jgi:hypothetical protein
MLPPEEAMEGAVQEGGSQTSQRHGCALSKSAFHRFHVEYQTYHASVHALESHDASVAWEAQEPKHCFRQTLSRMRPHPIFDCFG